MTVTDWICSEVSFKATSTQRWEPLIGADPEGALPILKHTAAYFKQVKGVMKQITGATTCETSAKSDQSIA